MKKVLFLFHDFSGGAERINIDVLNALHKNFFEACVVCFSERGIFRSRIRSDIQVISLDDENSIIKIKKYFSLVKLLKKNDIIVATVELKSALCAVFLCGRKSVIQFHKLLSRYLEPHSCLYAWIYRLCVQFCVKRAGKVLCISHDIMNEIHLMCKNGDNIYFVPNFIDQNEICTAAEVPLPKPIEEFVSDGKFILGVGRLEQQKRFDVLIDAFSSLRKDNIDCKLCILGEGSKRNELQMKIHELNLQPYVLLAGAYSPYTAMKRASVVCQTSDYEGYPTIIMESLTIGTPVVVTDTCMSVHEIIDNNLYGKVIKVNCKDDLVEALKEYLLKNKKNENSCRKIFPKVSALTAWHKIIVQ